MCLRTDADMLCSLSKHPQQPRRYSHPSALHRSLVQVGMRACRWDMDLTCSPYCKLKPCPQQPQYDSPPLSSDSAASGQHERLPLRHGCRRPS